MKFPTRLIVLLLPLLAVSCQSDAGFTDARAHTQSRVNSSKSQVAQTLTTLKFPMTRAELAEHIPAVRLEKAPRVLLRSAAAHPKGTEYCRLGDGLTLVMPVDYKHGVSHGSNSSGGAASSALQVRTDAGDIVKGAVIATTANRGPACVNCSTARYMKILHAGL
jgi:hypothetical protein